MNLTLQRCLIHVDREAVARCPACRNYFCRECVTEHKRKFLCSNCLQSVVASVKPARRNAERFMLVIRMTIGMAIAWLFFYVIGQLLMLIPPNVHDGSYLRHLGQ
jgi:uncharacterized protein YybS (DUF2232 family)